MRTHDILLTIKAIELLTKGADIDSFKDEATIKNSYFNKDNKLISRLSENVEDFYWILTDDLRQFLGLHVQVLRRAGKCFYGVVEEAIPEDAAVLKDVSKEIFLSTVQQLYKRDICTYPDLLRYDKDPDYLETVKQKDVNYKPDTIPEDFVSKLSKDKTDFFLKILLATCYSNTREVMEKLYEYNNAEKNWDDLKRAFPNGQIIDDRLYVPVLPSSRMALETSFSPNALDECEYIVISKNIYDYFFCSYGSAHQSCYSLNSPHRGFFGMIPMILSDNHYIVYGTKSRAQSVTVGGTDKKYPAPYMFFRSWGWMSDDGVLLVDKIYTSITETKYIDNFLTKNGFSIPQSSERIPLKEYTKYNTIFNKFGGLRFYPDSIRSDWKHFCRGDGIRSFIGSIPLKFPVKNCETVISALSTFTVDKDLDIYKDIAVVDGKMFNPKHCPITNLIITDTEDAHWLSTIVKKPVKNLMMIEWNDGLYRINITNNFNQKRTEHFFLLPEDDGHSQYDEGCHTFLLTSMFSRKTVTLQKIKTWIQNYKAELENDIDLIVLKVVDKNQLNFIKYSTGK